MRHACRASTLNPAPGQRPAHLARICVTALLICLAGCSNPKGNSVTLSADGSRSPSPPPAQTVPPRPNQGSVSPVEGTARAPSTSEPGSLSTSVAVSGVLPTATPPVLLSPSELTLDDNGGTARFKIGDTFAVRLEVPPPFAGSVSATWQISLSDPGVLTLVSTTPTAPPVVQGVYRATARGVTTLYARTHYPCYDVRPPCDIPQRDFQITIVVDQIGP